MSKDHAYYFKFIAPTWLASTSKVQLLNYEEKGIFIELCAMLLMENGRIKNDELLHRKLRIEKAKLSNCFNLLFELNLLVSDGKYLSVKFISEALFEMKTKSKILSQNGAKGGRPKSQRKPPSDQENQKYHKNQKENYKENNTFEESPQPPEENSDLKFIGNGKEGEKSTRKPGYMERAWLDSGKPKSEYDRRTARLPELSVDDRNCIECMDIIDPDKSFLFDLRRAKAILGTSVFSEELHMLKTRVQEGAADNPAAYFATLIKNAIKNLEV